MQPFLRGFIFCLLVPLGVYAQSGQPAAPPERSSTVLKANTRLVIVDVVVTDSKGAPVSGLESTDFTVLENGRPQTISNFSFQHPGALAGPAASLPPNVFTNIPKTRSSSLNVLLVDALNGDYSGRAYALDQLSKYLGSDPPMQPTAIFVLEQKLKLLHDFTTDPRALKQALAAYNPKVAPHVDDVYSAASAFTQKGTIQATPVNIEATLKGLTSLAQTLSGYAGRKNLIWLSEAFPINLFPDQVIPSSQSALQLHTTPAGGSDGGAAQQGGAFPVLEMSGYNDYLAMVAKVADALMAAQVAVYPIDAAGVGRVSRIQALSTMRSMAERTGGITFANQNKLDTSIRSSMDDGSTYYTLAYYPDDKNWDGKFRRIEIKSSHAGVNLRYRLGYYALDPGLEAAHKGDARKVTLEFTQALALGSPSSTAVLFRATVLPPSASGQKVQVNFAIDPHTLTYAEKENGVQEASLGCAIVAYSEKGALVRDEINNVVGKVKPGEFPKLMASNFPCQCTIELKPGKYTLRLGVLDKPSSQIGTTTASVTVP